MGQSTDAILWYGIVDDEEDGDLAEKLREIANGPDEDGGGLYGDGREWFEAHGLAGKLVVVDHCSCDYAMYGLAVVGVFPDSYDKATLTARRGSPKTFAELPTVQTEWGDLVRSALKEMGVDGPEPGWCLASMWC